MPEDRNNAQGDAATTTSEVLSVLGKCPTCKREPGDQTFATLVMIGGQTMIVFVVGVAISVTRLNVPQWGYSIALGFFSIPVGMIVRLVPDEIVRKCIPDLLKRKRTLEVIISDDHYRWNQGMLEICDELAFLKKVRGGLLRGLSSKVTHLRESFSKSRSSCPLPGTPDTDTRNNGSASYLPTPNRLGHDGNLSTPSYGPATAMVGIVAGSVAGWSPSNAAITLKVPPSLFMTKRIEICSFERP